jgi:magnesium-transporting ATPase (P-type)
MIQYFFYKNLVFTIPQFFFTFLWAFSGQTIYDDWYITFYNMVFTALPLLMRSIYERDICLYEHMEDIDPDIEATRRDVLENYYPKTYELG